MGFRFRKSFRIAPGLRINLTHRGVSGTVGASPFSVNIGKRGIQSTASIPGSGLSYVSQRVPPSTRLWRGLLVVVFGIVGVFAFLAFVGMIVGPRSQQNAPATTQMQPADNEWARQVPPSFSAPMPTPRPPEAPR